MYSVLYGNPALSINHISTDKKYYTSMMLFLLMLMMWKAGKTSLLEGITGTIQHQSQDQASQPQAAFFPS